MASRCMSQTVNCCLTKAHRAFCVKTFYVRTFLLESLLPSAISSYSVFNKLYVTIVSKCSKKFPSSTA